jgi:hypothetical protein
VAMKRGGILIVCRRALKRDSIDDFQLEKLVTKLSDALIRRHKSPAQLGANVIQCENIDFRQIEKFNFHRRLRAGMSIGVIKK